MHDQVVVPDGDLLIHCGDWTGRGTMPAIEKFLNWFGNQPCPNKCFTAGNHELALDKGPMRNDKLALIKKYADKYNMHYLEDSGTTINGLNIWASPATPYFYGWAFNKERGHDIKQHWDLIPDNTNILITHGPPYGILDVVPLRFGEHRDPHQGCEELAKRVKELKDLKLSCYGHIHSGYGQLQINNTTFVNASTCTEEYAPTNKPMVINL